ncbi:sterol desaturase family protein [Leucothrix pacifica]|uniref:Desaturase n=1 Tax=Leucothrix pacifica TaxID=1247513 RepID=A0A317C7S2_9GAMM|nr:sterol desaturase family protein [Leucothrix pacifica]PWQ92360.1 desaturase [Leucothrix pacifica]
MTTQDKASTTARNRFETQWHYRPDVPTESSPLFQWPLKPLAIWHWFAARWLVLGENTVLVALALISWFWFQPPLEVSKTLSIDWIAPMYLRNLALMIGVAGGLHLYFFYWKKQGKQLRHDERELVTKGRNFTFGNQVRDNMFWTLASGVTFWTAYEVLMFWAMANGYAPLSSWSDNPVWFVLLFLLTPLWISLHFYLVHRWMHYPKIYQVVHKLHHRNNNVGPWSGLSMHPLEHLVFFSSILIHFVIAAHPLHILFHMMHQSLTASTSHTGYNGLLVKGKNRFALGTFPHQLHHRYLDCNYGNPEVPCDKWFGTFHDGTAESHEKLQQRRREKSMSGT